MVGWRDIRSKARGVVHRTFAVSAKRYPGGDPASVPEDWSIRVHPDVVEVGDQPGTAYEYAEVDAGTVMLVGLVADGVPERGDVFKVAHGEAYRISHTAPRSQPDLWHAFAAPLKDPERYPVP